MNARHRPKQKFPRDFMKWCQRFSDEYEGLDAERPVSMKPDDLLWLYATLQTKEAKQ